jgi:hypothetical protein
MDEIVKAALSKWPNVPHCYSWLALDARGAWRMRDERAQTLNLPGDKIHNAALTGFINRNYQHDEQGRWYFQNGPQRVYVDLAATPYIARTSPEHGFVLHTGATLSEIDNVFLSADGKLFIQTGEILAQLDDRDLGACLGEIQVDGKPVSDQKLMAWLENTEEALNIQFSLPQKHRLNIQRGELTQLMKQFGFISTPRID